MFRNMEDHYGVISLHAHKSHKYGKCTPEEKKCPISIMPNNFLDKLTSFAKQDFGNIMLQVY